MKKIKLFALALMATFSLSAMAVDPDLSINDQSQGSESFLKTYETQAVTISSSASFSSGAVQLGNTPSSYDQHYLEVLAANNAIDSISFLISGNGSNKSIQAPVFGWAETATGNEAATYAILDPVVVTANSYSAAQWFTYNFSAADVKCLRIYRTTKYISSVDPEYAGSSTALGSGQTIKIYGIKVWLHPNCEEPETALSIVPVESAPYYVGNTIHFSLPGGNGSAKALTLDGVPYDDLQWLMEEGEHTFAVSQDLYNGICGGSAELTINVLSQNPVTSCSIDGPATGVIGAQLTYTATAANATTYEWYVDGVAANNNSATFNYTATIGNHVIKAFATNDFTTLPVESNEINVTVTQLYGGLISYTFETGSGNIDKDFTVPADDNNIIGGTGHQKTQKNRKLGSNGHYVSLKLAEGSFLEGDTVKVVIIPEYNSSKDTYSVPATIKLSSDLDNTDIIGEATHGVTPTSEDPIYLEIVITKDVETIYLARNATVGQNPIVESMAVVRPLDDGSPVLKASQTAIELAVTAEEPNPSVVVNFSGKHLTPGSYGIVVPNLAGLTVAPASVTVGDDGKLDAAIAISYESADDVAANATSVSLTIDAIEVVVGISYSATHAKTYLSANVNIEQAVLDHGTKYDIKSDITAAGWTFENLNDLDTLNDLENKTNRNEAFLGLKVKAANAYIAGWLQADGILLVKFGNLGSSIKVNVTGATTNDEQTFTAEDLAANGNVLPIYGYTEDVYVKISTVTGGTVVLKQLMLDDIAEVTLPAPSAYLASVAAGIENGTVTLSWPNKKYRTPVGETVTVTVTPNDGFEIDQVTVGDAILLPEGGVYSFEMPAQDVEVAASFKAGATALDEAEEAVKARKIVRDGQIIIVRGDKEFNLVGAEL